MRTPLIAGNWKMYKTTKEAREFAAAFKGLPRREDVDVAICAPYTQLTALVEAFAGTDIGVGAQNVHYESEGAYTGEISVGMLTEIGLQYCIVGHSERRQYFNETDEAVNRKLKVLLEQGIRPILCVGEGLSQREAGLAGRIVDEQVRAALDGLSLGEAERVIVAYEPIWAIGTGLAATPAQAGEMCGLIRQTVCGIYDEVIGQTVRILYGGSVKPENVAQIMTQPDIDGALVGGASLDPQKFNAIVNF